MGLPKTGTSALQRLLYEQRHQLRRAGVFYSADVQEYRHQRLVSALMGRFQVADTKAFLSDDADIRCVVWSAEGFSHNLYRFPEENLERLAEMTVGHNRSIYLVTRDRQAFLWSFYKQCLINPANGAAPYYGQDIGYEDFVKLPYVTKLSNYAVLSRDLEAAFRGQVMNLGYDDMTLPDIFEELTGVPVPADAEIGRVNLTYPDALIDEVRAINSRLSGAARQEAIASLGIGTGSTPAEPHVRRRIARDQCPEDV